MTVLLAPPLPSHIRRFCTRLCRLSVPPSSCLPFYPHPSLSPCGIGGPNSIVYKVSNIQSNIIRKLCLMRRWCNRSKTLRWLIAVHFIGIYEMSNISGTPTFLRNFAIPLPATQPLLFSDVAPVALLMPLSVSDVCVVRWEGGQRGEGTFTAGTESNALPLSPLFPHL